MKTLNIHRTITAGELLSLLQQKLNPLFHEQRHNDISFIFENNNNIIQILQPALYELPLFAIEVKGRELHIIRTADYIDDVNALTIESILNQLFEETAADGEVTLVSEG